MMRPTILVCAGHDPSGGAGIQADIEAIAARGGHAATAVSVLTIQDTANVIDTQAVDSAFFCRAVDNVCADMPIAAIKTGVLANAEQISHVARLKQARPDVPLVVDPVLAAAGGGRLADDAVGHALTRQLIPIADLITPNLEEAQRLLGCDTDQTSCAHELAKLGTSALVTGGDGTSAETESVLETTDGQRCCYTSKRLAGGPFHGSGCTLASAIAAELGHAHELAASIENATAYVHECLANAATPGNGQPIPLRTQAS